MKIFALSGDLSFHLIAPAEGFQDSEGRYSRLFRRTDSIRSDWSKPLFRKYTIEELEDSGDPAETIQRKAKGVGDFPSSVGPFILLSDNARQKIGGLFEKFGELLPAHLEGEGDLWVYHCTNRIDAVDMSASVYDVRKGVKMWPKKLEFNTKKIQEEEIFTVDWPSPFKIFVTESVLNKITSSGLVGATFKTDPKYL